MDKFQPNSENFIRGAVITLWFLLCWSFLFFIYPYHLHFREQLILFLCRSDYLITFLYKPALLTEIAGEYLTQFYLLKGAGATILTSSLLLSWLCIRAALRRIGAGGNAGIFALLPISAELLLSCHIEYPLSMVLAIIPATLGFILYTKIENRSLSVISAILFLPLLYIIAGAHFLIFPIFVIVYELRSDRSLLFPVALTAVAISVPLLLRHFYNLTAEQSFFFPVINGYMLQLPYSYLITEITITAVAIISPLKINRLVMNLLPFIFCAAGLYIVIDIRQEAELFYACESYYGNWDRILKSRLNEKYMTNTGSYCINLALSRNMQLPDQLLNYYQPAYHGLFKEINESTGYINTILSTEALYECGDIAQAQHSGMLAMTFTPHQRSSRVARRLAVISAVNGDYALAKKFLLQLESTSLHRNWAERQMKLLTKDSIAVALPEIAEKRSLLSKKDILFSPNEWFRSLRNLLESNPLNKKAADYLLCFHLLNKDLGNFKTDYDKYYLPQFGRNPPRLYQEALLLCMDEKGDPDNQLNFYHISAQTYEDCLRYIGIYGKERGNGRTLRAEFGKTYWFYYYYAQIK